ncbi:MAG: DUF4405 domain-containing protein [Thermoguttaceae bacterium]|nr:DUF4405 domain-containing protein [Thermoguttaceae bacterium]
MHAKLKSRYYVDYLLFLAALIAGFSGLALWGWLAPPEKTRPVTPQLFIERPGDPPPGAPDRRGDPPRERRDPRDRNDQNPWDFDPTKRQDDDRESAVIDAEGRAPERERQTLDGQTFAQDVQESLEQEREQNNRKNAELDRQDVDRDVRKPPQSDHDSRNRGAQGPPPRVDHTPRPQPVPTSQRSDVGEEDQRARLFWGLMRGDTLFGLSKTEWSIVYRWDSVVLFVLMFVHLCMHARWLVRTTVLLNEED